MTVVETSPPAPLLNPVLDADVYDTIKLEQPGDRLKVLWAYWYDRQRRNPHLTSVLHDWFAMYIATFVLSGIAATREARRSHRETALALRYETHVKGMRHYYDATTAAGLRGGLQYAFRFSVLTGIFLFSSKSISVYRNKSSLIEYLASGFLAGALYRVHLGPRAMLAGGTIFSAAGLVFGCLMVPMLRMGHITQEEVHFHDTRTRLEEDRRIEELAYLDPVPPIQKNELPKI